MCDSGIFTREGATLAYDQLFEAYARMGVEYGVMIDVFQNPQATIESAKRALRAYKSFKNSFKLVGVAHGNSIDEYLDCYAQLKRMGFNYVAIGGLLRRRKNTVRYPYVQSQDFMFQVLRELRQRYSDDWLFALGSFHPSRLQGFKELNTWADYKGWIFQYKKQDDILSAYLGPFVSNHLQHLEGQDAAAHVLGLQRIVARRDKMVMRHKRLSQRLFHGRRTLRTALASLHQELLEKQPEIAVRCNTLTTHGLLSATEEKFVNEILHILGKQSSSEGYDLLENIHTNRVLKQQIKNVETYVDQANATLVKNIVKLKTNVSAIPEETQHLSVMISSIVEKTKRDHRFQQVQDRIVKKILIGLNGQIAPHLSVVTGTKRL